MNSKLFKNPTHRQADTPKEKLTVVPDRKEYQARSLRSLDMANMLYVQVLDDSPNTRQPPTDCLSSVFGITLGSSSLTYEHSNKGTIKPIKDTEAQTAKADVITHNMGSIPLFNMAAPFVDSAETLLA